MPAASLNIFKDDFIAAKAKDIVMNKRISASLMCVDLLDLRGALRQLEDQGIDLLHCDAMDGHFVPNWMMFPDLINAISRETALPLDIHLMVEEPQRMLPSLRLREHDIVSLSYESTPHIHRALSLVKDAGAIPALALNPGTPLCVVEDLLPDISMLLLMSVNPGFAGQKLIPQSIEKIRRARRMLDDLGYHHVRLEVDGNCSFEHVPRMVAAGADTIVAGSSSLFQKGLTLQEAARKLRQAMGSAT